MASNLETIVDNRSQKESINKGIVYTTAVLFIDYYIGHALTKKPFHESLGMSLPEYVNNIEMVLLGTGWFYMLQNPIYSKSKKIRNLECC